MEITPIPCLSDNYAYIINDSDSKTIGVVDPSEARPVIAFLEEKNLKLNFILNTHHHFDHIGGLYNCLGINMMLQRKSPLKIYGPPGTSEIIRGLMESCNVPRATGFGIPGQTLPHPNEFVEVYDLLPEHTLNFDDLTLNFFNIFF